MVLDISGGQKLPELKKLFLETFAEEVVFSFLANLLRNSVFNSMEHTHHCSRPIGLSGAMLIFSS